MKRTPLFLASCRSFLAAPLFLGTVLTCSTVALAAQPLITDDAGTIGKGHYQVELAGEYGYDKVDGVTTQATEAGVTLSYGLSESMDLVVGAPYQYVKTKEDGLSALDNGISDTSLELKWRLYEQDDLSFAVKPGLSLPTGDDDKGLGTGKVGYGLLTVLSKEMDPWGFHLNLGYVRNENTADEEKDIWHASIASCFAVTDKLTVAADLGIETNTDQLASEDPAYFLAGMMYAVTEDLVLDCGVKFGLNEDETDTTVIAGLTWIF